MEFPIHQLLNKCAYIYIPVMCMHLALRDFSGKRFISNIFIIIRIIIRIINMYRYIV